MGAQQRDDRIVYSLAGPAGHPTQAPMPASATHGCARAACLQPFRAGCNGGGRPAGGRSHPSHAVRIGKNRRSTPLKDGGNENVVLMSEQRCTWERPVHRRGAKCFRPRCQAAPAEPQRATKLSETHRHEGAQGQACRKRRQRRSAHRGAAASTACSASAAGWAAAACAAAGAGACSSCPCCCSCPGCCSCT